MPDSHNDVTIHGYPPIGKHGVSQGSPIVKGRCPACGWKSLFLGSGGYVTCCRLDCPDPCAAGDLLARGRDEGRAEPGAET